MIDPRVEDAKYCSDGTHLWIKKKDGSIYCYTCDQVKK